MELELRRLLLVAAVFFAQLVVIGLGVFFVLAVNWIVEAVRFALWVRRGK